MVNDCHNKRDSFESIWSETIMAKGHVMQYMVDDCNEKRDMLYNILLIIYDKRDMLYSIWLMTYDKKGHVIQHIVDDYYDKKELLLYTRQSSQRLLQQKGATSYLS